MRYNQLGNSGLLVSELCLGTMTFGGKDGIWKQIGMLQQEDADQMLRTALDAGINFLDTADIYSEGRSEEITGQAIRNLGIPRDDIIIATKVFVPTGTGPNCRGNSRHHILGAVEDSLRRLNVSHIDLYQLHGFDRITPVEETMQALDSLVQRGLVRYVGVSNWAAWQIMKAQGLCERNNLTRIVSHQAYYTLVGRDVERELVPMMRAEKIGLMVWGPLASGLLSGKYVAQDSGGRRSGLQFPPVDDTRASAVLDVMRPMAERKGVSMAQIALSWLLHQPAVTSIIIGANRQEQLHDNIAATSVVLDADELHQLDSCSRLPAEYPGWMFDMQYSYRTAQLDQPGRGAQ